MPPAEVGAVDLLHDGKVFVVLGLHADRDASVGDHQIRAAPGVEIPGRGNERVAVGHVKGIGEMPAAGQACCHCLEFFRVAADKAQLVAALGVASCKLLADAARSARNEDSHLAALPVCRSDQEPSSFLIRYSAQRMARLREPAMCGAVRYLPAMPMFGVASTP